MCMCTQQLSIYRLYANKTEDLINERKIHFVSKQLMHTTKHYITAPNVFSMERLIQFFAIYVTLIKWKCDKVTVDGGH